MRISKFFLTGLLAALAFAGCKTLKAVNDVSSAASANLQEFDALGTSVTNIYVQDYRERTYADYSDPAIRLRTDTPQTTNLFPVNLAEAKQADTLLRRIYTALHGYFAALAKLSADGLVDYTLDTVTTSLSAGAVIDTTKISPGTIAAISGIALKLGEFVSHGYRLHQIKKYVVESEPFVQRLIRDMKAALNSEKILLSTEQRYLKNHVYDSLLTYSTSRFERKQVIDAYIRVTAETDNRERRLESYELSLDVIAAAHAYIAAHVDELRSDKVKKDLTQIASLLQDRYSEFNALTQRPAN